MRPPVRAVVGNLIWSADGGAWALWRVGAFPYAYGAGAYRHAVHAHLRTLLSALPSEALLLSVCGRIDPDEVTAAMATGVDLANRDDWGNVCRATSEWLEDAGLYRRLHYLAVPVPSGRPWWRDELRRAAADVTAAFGIAPRPVQTAEIGHLERRVAVLAQDLSAYVPLQPASAGEVCWLHARILRREADEPVLDASWEPTRGLRAWVMDAVVKNGGYRNDDDRPHHRRYVRIDSPGGTSFQTVLAMADLPHHAVSPDAEPAWLFDVDAGGFPVDWCVRLSGDRATVLLSVAASTPDALEERVDDLVDRCAPHRYGLVRPVLSQAALLRSMLPGTAAAADCRRYARVLTPDELAAAGPFCSTELGDPVGLLVGLSLDGGTGTPVLLEPSLAARAGLSSSLALVGAPGSGTSYLLKRLLWDTVARGYQVVVVDRSQDGEYARFAASAPGRARVVQAAPDMDMLADANAHADEVDLAVLWAPDADEAALQRLATLANDMVASDPRRFGVVIYDEVGSLLDIPAVREVVLDGLATGAERNAAVWLATDDPGGLLSDELWELPDLVGGWFVFDQLPTDIPAALTLLGTDADEAATALADGLSIGRCLHRDSQERIGLIQVVPPLVPSMQPAFEGRRPRRLEASA